MNIIVNTCNYFVPKSITTSATICANCGLEKWQHALPNLQPMDNAKQEYGKIKKFAMTQEEILEGNKLINAFMGYPYNMTKNGYPEQVIYHSSWDWLMPVVEKIESLRYEVAIHSTWCNINRGTSNDLGYIGGETKIEAVYKGVIHFIKWHKITTNE